MTTTVLATLEEKPLIGKKYKEAHYYNIDSEKIGVGSKFELLNNGVIITVNAVLTNIFYFFDHGSMTLFTDKPKNSVGMSEIPLIKVIPEKVKHAIYAIKK